MNHHIMWTARQWPGCEHLDLHVGNDGVIADGLILAAPDGEPIRLGYRIECDHRWRTRALTIDPHGAPRRILTRDEDDHWFVDGRPRADLNGCTDVDIALTPFTNTLPIRRLHLAPDQATWLRIVYIQPIPELTVTAVDQKYTRIDSGYRYESGDFSADLTVDAAGLVTDYPGLWTMNGT